MSAASPTAGSRASRLPTSARPGGSRSRRPREAAGREIDPEHYGVMALYTHDKIPEGFAQAIAARNPDVDIDDLVARRARAAARPLRALHRGRVLEARARTAQRAPRLERRARRERGRAPPPADLEVLDAGRAQCGVTASIATVSPRPRHRRGHRSARATEPREKASFLQPKGGWTIQCRRWEGHDGR